MKEILTKENAHTASVVSCINHPEWGTWSFLFKEQPLPSGYTHVIRGDSGSRILSEDEFHFWQIETYLVMTQEEKIESNKLIAQFMGYRRYEEGCIEDLYFNEEAKHWVNISIESFDCDWNRLMPVIEKIENLMTLKNDGSYYIFDCTFIRTEKEDYNNEDFDWGNSAEIDYITHCKNKPMIYENYYVAGFSVIKRHSINGGIIASSKADSRIKATYKAVVDFIKWHNQQIK